MSTSEIVNKVWNYAHVLRDDGVGYGDYVEQITYLIFLKMANEREKAGQQVQVPKKYAWAKLVKLDGDNLELQYRHTLENLCKQGGMLGTIFRKAQNKIQDPAKLERLIKMIEKEQWSTLSADVKGDIYDGLLERNAQDTKGGAGQYCTPRPLIDSDHTWSSAIGRAMRAQNVPSVVSGDGGSDATCCAGTYECRGRQDAGSDQTHRHYGRSRLWYRWLFIGRLTLIH